MFENVHVEHEHPARPNITGTPHEMARLSAATVRLVARCVIWLAPFCHPTRLVRLRLVRNSAAVTALEYAILASLVAIVIVASLRVLGSSTSSTFQKLATTL